MREHPGATQYGDIVVTYKYYFTMKKTNKVMFPAAERQTNTGSEWTSTRRADAPEQRSDRLLRYIWTTNTNLK